MKLFVSVLLLFATVACSDARDAVRDQRWLCGEAFAIALTPHEKATTESPVEDFVLHTVYGRVNNFVIYEGNAPKEGGFVHRTGLPWPRYVAIAAGDPNEGAPDGKYAERIDRRLRYGTEKMKACPSKGKS